MKEEFITLPSGQVPRYNVLVEYRYSSRGKSFRELYKNKAEALEAYRVYCEMGDFEKNIFRVVFIDRASYLSVREKVW